MTDIDVVRGKIARLQKLVRLIEQDVASYARYLQELNNELSHISDGIKYQQQCIDHALSTSMLAGDTINPLLCNQAHDFLSEAHNELDRLHVERNRLMTKIEATSNELMSSQSRRDNLQLQIKDNLQQLHAEICRKELTDVCELYLLREVMSGS
jgi:septal ring factor EnvC (AmiA/AmiB activator)